MEKSEFSQQVVVEDIEAIVDPNYDDAGKDKCDNANEKEIHRTCD